ncbi:TPA: hypothetical protein HL449_23900 [Escherichia coli]|nr:hypothetical protein [Salmonella enterica subsp. enterica serovar Typhimurium]EBE7048077.1 hypothetical protein [Salmonella enterica]EDA8982925.1 hypothetical protein [Salmonella enterica subsp. enterica serovar Saintpaul]EDJ9236944.1 hypothetical protein [Salmonella enterica subsp. enterica serovar Infantis]EFA7514902.1 hypothetical protein [Escherichia coli]EFX6625698.1 hypothetical protein [Shigella sonnei]QHP12670.1 hypothetical protein DQG43_27705 [Klebsiella pneumoniae]
MYIDLCNCLILICSIQHQMKVNLSSRQPGGCGLSWPGITVIKKDNVIVFQVVIWPVQLNPVNANPHHKEANFPAML